MGDNTGAQQGERALSPYNRKCLYFSHLGVSVQFGMVKCRSRRRSPNLGQRGYTLCGRLDRKGLNALEKLIRREGNEKVGRKDIDREQLLGDAGHFRGTQVQPGP